MERDFMGLNARESVVVVKEEAVEGCKDSGFQWPLSTKVSALPHFMSFKVAQEEKAAKAASDPIASCGFMATSTADAVDTTLIRQMQKVRSGQGGIQFSITYPEQHNANFAGATAKQQFIGGIPILATHLKSRLGFVAGTTEPWFNSKSSGAPQLTIFYADAVNVYNNISPEKAQAIMFLAGNGSTPASKMAQPRTQARVPVSKQAGGPTNIPSISGLSSPMSVSSHPIGQSGNGTTTNDELFGVNRTGALNSHVASARIPSAVPQARQASLARFLEKRKERVMNMAPYTSRKKSPECSSERSDGAVAL